MRQRKQSVHQMVPQGMGKAVRVSAAMEEKAIFCDLGFVDHALSNRSFFCHWIQPPFLSW
jgi:hypothetical protein